MAAGVELSDLNWLALLAGFATAIVLGFIWYAPQMPTGRYWMKELKMDPNAKPPRAQMIRGMILMLIGTFLLMFVLQHVFLAFRDAYRLDGERLVDGLTYVDGLMGGFMTWLGFYLPVQLGLVGWENRTWKFMMVVTGYYLVTLLAVGLIFAAMM